MLTVWETIVPVKRGDVDVDVQVEVEVKGEVVEVE